MPSRRGLLAPQNTFLENVMRMCCNQHSHFLLANARIVDFPVVYCNEGLCQLTGFERSELVQKPAVCSAMHGEQTTPESVARLHDAMEQQISDQFEIQLYRKNKSPLWLLLQVSPVRNEKEVVVLLLIVVKDITALRQPIDEDSYSRAALSKFARLARSVTKNRGLIRQPLSLSSSLNIDSARSSQLIVTMPVRDEASVPHYRQEVPKTPPHIILHYSGFKSYWDWLILVLTFYTAVMVPYNAAFQGKTMDNVPVLVVDSMVDVVFFVDILLNFHMTFVGSGGEIVSEPRIIRMNYLKGWFVVDLLSCLPYDVFNAFHDNSEDVSSLFSALKVVRLLRLGRVARKLDHYIEYGAAVLVLLIVMFVLIAHWFACVWFTIGTFEASHGVQYGWMQRLGREIDAVYVNTNGTDGEMVWEGGPSTEMAYATALYFTLSCMTSVGFGNVSAYTEYEKIFSICMMIFGSLLYATIFGNVTTIFQQMYSTSARYHEMLNSIKDFMKIHNVPKSLGERVIDYVVSTWSRRVYLVAHQRHRNNKGEKEHKTLQQATMGNMIPVLNYCPSDMRADICVHLNRVVFNEHNAFRLASDGCLRALAVHFTVSHWAPGDMLFHKGESIDSLCFVVSGSLEVIQDDEIVAVLGRGDVLGDLFWKETSVSQSTANVRALTYCNLHIIKREPLLEVLRFYSAFANSFARNLKLTYNLRRRVVFRKIADVLREKELAERDRNQPPIELSNDHPVRRLISRFRRMSCSRPPSATSGLPLSDFGDTLTVDQQPLQALTGRKYSSADVDISNGPPRNSPETANNNNNCSVSNGGTNVTAGRGGWGRLLARTSYADVTTTCADVTAAGGDTGNSDNSRVTSNSGTGKSEQHALLTDNNMATRPTRSKWASLLSRASVAAKPAATAAASTTAASFAASTDAAADNEVFEDENVASEVVASSSAPTVETVDELDATTSSSSTDDAVVHEVSTRHDRVRSSDSHVSVSDVMELRSELSRQLGAVNQRIDEMGRRMDSILSLLVDNAALATGRRVNSADPSASTHR